MAEADLFGVGVEEMYENYIPMEVVALFKCVDEDGDERWISRTSAGVSDFERYGILTFEAARIKQFHVDGFERDGDDD